MYLLKKDSVLFKFPSRNNTIILRFGKFANKFDFLLFKLFICLNCKAGSDSLQKLNYKNQKKNC